MVNFMYNYNCILTVYLTINQFILEMGRGIHTYSQRKIIRCQYIFVRYFYVNLRLSTGPVSDPSKMFSTLAKYASLTSTFKVSRQSRHI